MSTTNCLIDTHSTDPEKPNHQVKECSRWWLWWNSDEWWPCWIGLILFAIVTSLVCNDIPLMHFELWEKNPFDSFANRSNYQLLAFYPLSMFLVWLAFWSSGKHIGKNFLLGFTVIFVLTLVSKVIAAQKNIKSASLGDSIWAILFGMIVRNVLLAKRHNGGLPGFLKIVYQTEFYIATSLVLLCIDFHVLAPLAPKALLVSWIDTPLLFALLTLFGHRVLKIDLESSMITSGSTFICGSSAAMALGNSIDAVSKTELPIAILSIFTIPSIIVLPYIAKVLHFSVETSGAWFGGCIDSTGPVIASATIYGPKEAVETAAVVKMVQNVIIGPLAVIVALIWAKREEQKVKRESKDMEKSAEIIHAKPKQSSWALLWKRFPKFVLGFIITALFFNLAVPSKYRETTNSSSFIVAEWFSTFSFVSIGLGLNIMSLKRDAKLLASLTLLYTISQLIDIFCTLGLSILAFDIL